MSSIKRFRFFWEGNDRHTWYHTALLRDPSKTICGKTTAGMETDEKEYQLPPPRTNCFKCLKGIKNHWPEKGSYYADGLR